MDSGGVPKPSPRFAGAPTLFDFIMLKAIAKLRARRGIG